MRPPPQDSETIQTRESLLRRLNAHDTDGWQEFYRTYGKLVRDFAIHAGLTDTEADEVLQETCIAAARHLPEYEHDRQICRFKTWLLNQASWRIKDHFEKRNRLSRVIHSRAFGAQDDRSTSTIERVPDPASVDLPALFETEWRNRTLALAFENLKQKFSLKQLQVYQLHAVEGWPAATVAKSLGMSLTNVYVSKHRVAAALKKETRRLQKNFEALDAR